MKKPIEKIEKIAYLIDNNQIYKFIFISISTIITISLMGYYFGTFDQASHIPFLKKTNNPNLYPDDNFFTLKNTHYSFFWLLFIPFYRLNILEPSMFIIHCLSTFLTYLAIWELGKTLFSKPLYSFFSVITFIFPHISFAGFPLFEFSLLNRTFVLPLLLFAINLYLKQLPQYAYFIIGVVFNFHAISSFFIFTILFLNDIIKISKNKIINLIKNFILFTLFASPVFIWRFLSKNNFPVLDWNWYRLISTSLLANIFKPLAINPPFILINSINFIAILLFFIISKETNYNKKTTIKNFMALIFLFLVIHLITAYFFPFTFIIQFQLIRIGLFATFFFYLIASFFVVKEIKRTKTNLLEKTLLFSGLFSLTPLNFLFSYYSFKFNKLVKSTIVLNFSFYILAAFFSYKYQLWKPEIHIYPNNLKGYKVQLWAKNNTKINDIFIIPPHLWHFYDVEWRVISERKPLVTLSELLEAAFNPNYMPYWQKRFNDVAPNALKYFTNNPFENFEITKKAYYSNKETDFLKLAKKYNASYLVVEKPYHYSFILVYEDQSFRVYKIR